MDSCRAELYAKVRTTLPGAYLSPLGRVMRELISDDGRNFTKWLDGEIQKKDGKYYEKCAEYLANHSAIDEMMKFREEIDAYCWHILKESGYQGKQGNPSSLGKLLITPIKDRMEKNYFDADTQDTTDAARKTQKIRFW